MWYQWFFDGIGTEIISLILGLIVGGGIGYKIGISKNGVQKQEAADDSVQKQKMAIDANNSDNIIEGNVIQKQKAGNHAVQSQVGEIKHGCNGSASESR